MAQHPLCRWPGEIDLPARRSRSQSWRASLPDFAKASSRPVKNAEPRRSSQSAGGPASRGIAARQPVRQAHPFDRLRMTLSGVEWVRVPSGAEREPCPPAESPRLPVRRDQAARFNDWSVTQGEGRARDRLVRQNRGGERACPGRLDRFARSEIRGWCLRLALEP